MGNALDDPSIENCGGVASCIDRDTGQEIDGAYLGCGDCGYVPIREGMWSCPGCGKIRTERDDAKFHENHDAQFS